MASDDSKTNVEGLEGLNDTEVREYLVETARALSELALKAGEAEASALLSVVAGNLTKASDAA